MRIGSLFSGIGGLEKGLLSAGLGPVLFQCELDPFCRRVLAKHWPEVTRYEDVRTLGKEVPMELPAIDLLCGGFP
jgi:DNA (cytosine-5)-methyltransferase 1